MIRRRYEPDVQAADSAQLRKLVPTPRQPLRSAQTLSRWPASGARRASSTHRQRHESRPPANLRVSSAKFDIDRATQVHGPTTRLSTRRAVPQFRTHLTRLPRIPARVSSSRGGCALVPRASADPSSIHHATGSDACLGGPVPDTADLAASRRNSSWTSGLRASRAPESPSFMPGAGRSDSRGRSKCRHFVPPREFAPARAPFREPFPPIATDRLLFTQRAHERARRPQRGPA